MTIERQPRRSRPVGPLILIGLGVLLLLNNQGLIGEGAWQLVAGYWPAFLIMAGVAVLLGGRSRGLVAVAVVVALAAAALSWSDTPLAAAPAEVTTIAQELRGAERAEVEIDAGIAALHVGPGADDATLIEGTAGTRRGERLEQDFDLSGNLARYRLESRSRGVQLPWWNDGEARAWRLRLNPEVPTALTVNAGIGEVDLDLEDLDLSSLTVDSGIGETIITLPRAGGLEVDVDSGIGEVTILLPEDRPARILASTGIGSLSLSGDFERQGEWYVSSDYEGADADEAIELRVDGGIGAVEIRSY